MQMQPSTCWMWSNGTVGRPLRMEAAAASWSRSNWTETSGIQLIWRLTSGYRDRMSCSGIRSVQELAWSVQHEAL